MIKFKILQAPASTLRLIGVAKSKAEALISEFAGELGLFRAWVIGKVVIRMQANRYTNTEDWVVRLWLDDKSAGLTPILYQVTSYSPRTVLNASTAHGFEFAPEGAYSWDIITPTKLPALGAALWFDALGAPATGDYFNQISSASLMDAMKENVKKGNWLAIEQLNYLMTHITFTRGGVPFTVNATDCLLSAWNGDYRIMIGRWVTNTSPPPATMNYSGVVVRASKLARKLVDPNPLSGLTSWSVDLDDPELEAQSADSFSMLSTFLYTPISSFDVYTWVRRLDQASPYMHVYEKYDYTGLNLGTVVNVHTTTHNVKSWFGHRLSSSGQLEEAVISTLNTGTNVYDFVAPTDANPGSSISTWSAFSCDLGFFDGEKFVKHGTHTYSGGSGITGSSPSGNSGTFTEESTVPLFTGTFELNDISNRYSIAAYMPEYELALAAKPTGNPYVATIVSGAVAYSQTLNYNPGSGGPYNRMHYADDFFDHQATLGSPTGPTIFTHDNVVSVLVNHGPEFRIWPFVAYVGYTVPQGRAVPYAPANSTGLKITYWYRDGQTGVFMARVNPSDLPSGLDLAVWQATLNAISNGLPFNEAVAQAALDRILSKVEVLANNFASPALIPLLIGSPVVNIIATR